MKSLKNLFSLQDFIIESNKIEGIFIYPSDNEINAYNNFLALDKIKLVDIENFVNIICGKKIRSKIGMNVRVGNYIPPRGGPNVPNKLEYILACLNE